MLRVTAKKNFNELRNFIKMKLKKNIGLICLTALLISCGSPQQKEGDLSQLSWEEIEQKASGQTVNMMMWQGDPNINAYISNYVVPEVKERFNIDLEVSSGQGNTIVSILMTEIQAGKDVSEIDISWINGETFYQLRQVDALYGPVTNQLPNSKYINFENPFIGKDFQQPIDGFETPWGNVQMTMIYNRENTPNPPKTLEELELFVQQNPGQFTIPTEFTGMTFLKSLMISLAGEETLSGDFDEVKYEKYSKELWNKINGMKQHFWKGGETFPSSLSAMHKMFANGELAITMSNNDSEVDNKINQGLFSESARAYVLETGTIQNSHYLGIVNHSNKKAAAMTVINFMISPEAQYKKMDPNVWGDGTILSMDKLPQEWQEKFKNIPNREYAPQRTEIQPFALEELAPEYMIRLFEDFRTYVVQG